MNITVDKKPINLPALEAELRAASGPAYTGWSYNRPVDADHFTLHFADGTSDAVIATALKVYEAHDATVLTPAQQAEAERAAALNQLAAADFAGMVQAVEGAATLEDVRPLLLNALGALQALTLALGLKTNSETNS